MPSSTSLLEELIPASTGYICVICENPLILTMETSCRHKFCSHCISIWKKHHSLCPICTHDIGTLNLRPDIDELIDRFFITADPSMQNQRQDTIEKRVKANDLLKVTPKRDEMKALMDHLKPPGIANSTIFDGSIPRASTATSSVSGTDKKKDIDRLLRDTDRFEQQLNLIYSKILTTGERLTTREDQAVARLCSSVIDEGQGNLVVGYRHGVKNDRPHTAFGHTQPVRRSMTSDTAQAQRSGKDQSEIDSLLELTDDVLRIDHLLKTFNFDTLTEGGDDMEGQFTVGLESDDSGSILNDETLKTTTLQLLSDFNEDGTFRTANLNIHPEVQKYLDKCPIQVKPHLPFSNKKSSQGRGRPKTVASTPAESTKKGQLTNKSSTPGVDLTSKILQCRESLLTLKDKGENDPMPKLSFKPINYSGTQDEEGQSEPPPTDLTISMTFEHISGSGGNGSGMRSHSTRPLTCLSQLRGMKPMKDDTVSTLSLPTITNRQMSDKKTSSAQKGTRPQTAIDRKKPAYLLPRPH